MTQKSRVTMCRQEIWSGRLWKYLYWYTAYAVRLFLQLNRDVNCKTDLKFALATPFFN